MIEKSIVERFDSGRNARMPECQLSDLKSIVTQ